jgi:hypothetical protein
MTALTPVYGLAFYRRLTTGGFTSYTQGSGVAAPYWVKMVRAGSTFTAYASANGTAWSQVGTATISMGTNVYIGLALTSHNNPVLCQSTIDNVTVSLVGN